MTTRPQRFSLLAPLALALTGAACAAGAAEGPAPVAAPTAAAPAAATPAAPRPPALTAAQRQPYLGSYSITTPDGERITFRVFEENGMLKGQPGAEPALQLVHEGGDVFRSVGQYEYTVTFAVEAGRATGFTARNQGGVLQGVRIP
jgi:hypothetical protein